MKTAIQELWGYIEANYNEENFNIFDAKEKSLELEKNQIIESFKEGTKMVDINDELSAGFNAVMYFYETYTND